MFSFRINAIVQRNCIFDLLRVLVNISDIHLCSLKMRKSKRTYVQRSRGRKVQETRERIVEATVALHEELGPHQTTISGIAVKAGVERLTVYRHFPSERELFDACAASWLSRHPPPDPAAWQCEKEASIRTVEAFLALARYYAETRKMFGHLYRDIHYNQTLRKVMLGFEEYLVGIGDGLAEGWKVRGKRGAELKALIRHALRFSTWSSLEAEGLDDTAKARLLLRWVEAVAHG
jgi:AcrR family transcriptional regulator